jgi:hypothetical protein
VGKGSLALTSSDLHTIKKNVLNKFSLVIFNKKTHIFFVYKSSEHQILEILFSDKKQQCIQQAKIKRKQTHRHGNFCGNCFLTKWTESI